MCRSAADGGQRCAAHTRAAYERATFDTPEWDEAATAHATTPTGITELRDQLAHANTTGDHDLHAALTTALHRGQAHTAAHQEATHLIETTPPIPESLQALADRGYVIDEWKRWQQGGCAAYAIALIAAHPHLRVAVMGRTENGGGDATGGWSESHVFAHDDTYAYDSAGRHPLPYLGIDGANDYVELDVDVDYYGYRDEFTDDEFAAALNHATRHNIVPTTPTIT